MFLDVSSPGLSHFLFSGFENSTSTASEYCMLMLAVLGSNQEQGLEVHVTEFLYFTAASIAKQTVATWVQTSFSPAMQLQWANSIVPSSLIASQGRNGVSFILCEWDTCKIQSQRGLSICVSLLIYQIQPTTL